MLVSGVHALQMKIRHEGPHRFIQERMEKQAERGTLHDCIRELPDPEHLDAQ